MHGMSFFTFSTFIPSLAMPNVAKQDYLPAPRALTWLALIRQCAVVPFVFAVSNVDMLSFLQKRRITVSLVGCFLL